MLRFALTLSAVLSMMSPVLADDRSDAQSVIGNQIDSFKAKRYGEAFSYAAPGLQLMFRDENNFIRMVQRGYMPIYGAQSYRFGRSRADGANTMFQEVMITGPAGRSWVALYTMKRSKDGSWKIAGVRLVPGNEETT